MSRQVITRTAAVFSPYAWTSVPSPSYLLQQHSVLAPVFYQLPVELDTALCCSVPLAARHIVPVRPVPKIGSIVHLPSNPQASSIIWQARASQSKASLGHPAVVVGVSPCGQYVKYCPMTSFGGRRAAEKWAGNIPWAIAHRRRYLSLGRAKDVAETRHGRGCGKNPSDREFAVEHDMPLLEFVGGNFTNHSYVSTDSCWIEMSEVQEYKSGKNRLAADSLGALEGYMDKAKKIT